MEAIAGSRHDSLSYLQSLLDSIEDGVLVIDRNFRIVRVNRTFLNRFVKSGIEAVGQSCHAVFRDGAKACILGEEGCPSQLVFETGCATEATATLEAEDGFRQNLHIHSSPVLDHMGRVYQAIEFIRDVTERKQLESKLANAEKEAAFGRIAAGLAHEINNPMAAVATCVEGLQRRMAEPAFEACGQREEMIEYLEIIKQSAYRCKAIAENLLSFASRAPFDPEPVDLAAVLRHVCLLVEYDANLQNKRIVLALDSPQPVLLADRSQLIQLFLNLVLNALEASESGSEISITSKTNGGKVTVAVKDTGCGIPEENLDKIFEPFFTTKEPGKGTGMGLAICRGILRQHQGSIWVESELGVGSTFFVELTLHKNDEVSGLME